MSNAYQSIKETLLVAFWTVYDFVAWITPPLWAGAKRVGRVILWVLFPPLGFYRTFRHDQKKDRARRA